MQKEEIKQKLITVIAEQLGQEEADVKGDAHFIDDLGADSLDTVELVMAMEEEFDVEIADEDAEKIFTLDAALDFVSTKLS